VVDATDPSTDGVDATHLQVGGIFAVPYAWFDGYIAEVGGHATALRDTQVAWLSQALLARGTPPTAEAAPFAVNLLVEANSISDPVIGPSAGDYLGYGPPFSPTQMWPAQLAASHPSWSFTNLGRASRWTAPVGGSDNGGNVISPTYADHLAAYHDPDRVNVVVLWELINHLGALIAASDPTPGVTAAQALLTLGTTAVAAGWKVVIGTGSNRADGGVNATYQSEYLVANAHLRANGEGTAWHALADVGGDARFQDPDNDLYILSSDKVHFTLLGQSVAAAEFFGPAIAAAVDA
jgi:hypothetical protein